MSKMLEYNTVATMTVRGDGETTTTCSSVPCEHSNGFYTTIYFWIFKRRFFACEDCWTMIPKTKWTLI
jgi:hypothetical protein